MGAVTKPLVGVFDLASNVTAGVRETTTVFDANDIGRERLPRYIAMDHILRVSMSFTLILLLDDVLIITI